MGRSCLFVCFILLFSGRVKFFIIDCLDNIFFFSFFQSELFGLGQIHCQFTEPVQTGTSQYSWWISTPLSLTIGCTDWLFIFAQSVVFFFILQQNLFWNLNKQQSFNVKAIDTDFIDIFMGFLRVLLSVAAQLSFLFFVVVFLFSSLSNIFQNFLPCSENTLSCWCRLTFCSVTSELLMFFLNQASAQVFFLLIRSLLYFYLFFIFSKISSPDLNYILSNQVLQPEDSVSWKTNKHNSS